MIRWRGWDAVGEGLVSRTTAGARFGLHLAKAGQEPEEAAAADSHAGSGSGNQDSPSATTFPPSGNVLPQQETLGALQPLPRAAAPQDRWQLLCGPGKRLREALTGSILGRGFGQ